MNEVNEICSLCNKPNDQMLMLSCVHDPCINCAASAYAEQVYIKNQKRDVMIRLFRSISAKSVEKKLFWIPPLFQNFMLLPPPSLNRQQKMSP
jgi:hypothetical protein